MYRCSTIVNLPVGDRQCVVLAILTCRFRCLRRPAKISQMSVGKEARQTMADWIPKALLRRHNLFEACDAPCAVGDKCSWEGMSCRNNQGDKTNSLLC